MKMTALSWSVLAKILKNTNRRTATAAISRNMRKSRSIFPASHVGDRDGTEEGYQDTDLFVDESVDTAEQAICNLLMADLHRALQKLSQKERAFILDYYSMEKPSTLKLAKKYGISQPAAHKRLKKLKKNKKVGYRFLKKVAVASEREILSLAP